MPPSLPTALDDQIVQALRTHWSGSGQTWSWTGSLVTYQIGDTPAASGSPEAPYAVSMTSLMQSRAALAFELWDDVIQTDLVRTYGNANPDIQFAYSSQTENDGTYTATTGFSNGTGAYGLPNLALDTVEIWLNSDWSTHDTDADLYFGSYGFQTYLHEIGHSLGLSHPSSYEGADDASFSYWNNAEFAQDTRQYTVMSYFAGYRPGAGWVQEAGESDWIYSSTPMLYDVLAAQAIYGADYSTRNNDTVYGFNSTAGKAVFDFAQYTQPILTIWDGGGIDTLDTSGFAAQQRIDLNAGTYSNIGGLAQNIAIAFGALIENATGGSGNDTILGNSADNRLKGGAGNDTIDGGDGVDSAVYSGAYAQYTVTDLSGGGLQVSGPDGTDILLNIEKLVFSDQTVGQTPGTVTVSDASIIEGDSGTSYVTFTVTRTGGRAAFSVVAATADGTAKAIDGDYQATSTPISFGVGINSLSFLQPIYGDLEFEPNEKFTINLSNATNGATIGDGVAVFTIINDDTKPGTITISDATIVEGKSGTRVATFTVTRSGGTSPFKIDYATADGTATVANSDYVAASGMLSFDLGVNSQTISVTINGDTSMEADETFRINLSNATNGANVSDAQAVGTIANDDIAVTISDASIVEGNGGTKIATFVVTRTGVTTPFSVDYATTNGTATLADNDYVTAAGTLSFAVGVMSQTIAVTINGDVRVEADETFKVNLSKATNGVTIGDAQAIGTITNDDVQAGTVAISDVTIAEGNAGTSVATFTVTRSGGTAPFNVNYATANGTATVANGDYGAASGTLSFAAGVNSQTISVTVNGDTAVESNETFTVNLSGATNGATISDAQAVGTIVGDDIAVAISDMTIAEGDGGAKVATFTVTRTGATTPFSVNYATGNGTATLADGDYGAASGTLSFAAGIMSQTIAVTINGDTKVEADETFKVNLSKPTAGVTIADAQAIGTIFNDDFLPGSVAISDVTIAEGNSGTSVATFTVTRTGGTAPFSVNYATANGTATVVDGDYLAAAGTLSFGAGVNSQTIAVTIQGDAKFEADETFRVNLSGATNGAKIADPQAIGTIVNDDIQAGRVAISDVTIVEGLNGTKVATFTVSRTGGTAPFSVNYATADGTATVADGDYVATSGTLAFGAGVESKTISVKINGDTKYEADETFRVNLSGATNGATIGDALGLGTIASDDTPPGTVTISDVTIAEGNSGTKLATFTVTRTGGTAPFSVSYATADGTAKVADGDYLAASGVLSFGTGIESKTIVVKIAGDTRFEADETFKVNLSGATNGAKIGDSQAIGTIANDDTLPGTVAIADVTIAEGNSGGKVATFTVTRTGGTAAFNVDYATADVLAAASDGDYVAASGTLSFGDGVTSRTISVKINGDTRFEADETFRVDLSGATNGATIGDAQAIGTITNDDIPGTGNILIGDGKANTLKGGADIDLLYGLDGNDILVGGPANGGVNQLNGGRGIDTASYAGTASGVSADLALQRGFVSGVLTDRMDSIENLTGGTGNDTLLGDDNANIFTGGAGADRLSGRGGADIFVYGAWTDSNLVAGYDTVDDFVAGTDKIDLTALRVSAAHIAFVSMGASTMIHVGRTVGVFDPATDLALLVTTNAIGIDDLRL